MFTPSRWKHTLEHVRKIGRWANDKGFDDIAENAHFVDQLLTHDADLDESAVAAEVDKLFKLVRKTPTKDQLPQIAHFERFHALASEARAIEATPPTRGVRPPKADALHR